MTLVKQQQMLQTNGGLRVRSGVRTPWNWPAWHLAKFVMGTPLVGAVTSFRVPRMCLSVVPGARASKTDVGMIESSIDSTQRLATGSFRILREFRFRCDGFPLVQISWFRIKLDRRIFYCTCLADLRHSHHTRISVRSSIITL